MLNRLATSLAATFCVALLSAPALADESACGNFDFSGGLDCKLEVSGGCTAQCQPINFVVGCTGGCTATPQPGCVDSCGEQCLKECNPELLDCFEGCHQECDAPVQAECETKGGDDCPATSKAQCDIHCKESCKVPPSTCEEHCTSCCTGGCTTQVNYDCDFACFAELQGGCEVQCQKPEGALFCNGQYVHASDVTACVNYLIEQGLTVEGSGSLTCNAQGCDLEGAISACSASPADPLGTGLGAFGFGTLALGMVARAARRRRGSRD